MAHDSVVRVEHGGMFGSNHALAGPVPCTSRARNFHGIPLASGDMVQLFFPDLDPAIVAATLARSVSSAIYSPTEEVEAETFATLLLAV